MMENRIENIINGALELNAKINEKISEIDNCEAFIRKLDEGNLSLLMPEGEIIDLAPAITLEQKADIMYSIRTVARKNIESAVKFLERLSDPVVTAYVEPELPFVTVPQNTTSEPEYEPMMALEPEMTPEDYSYAKEYKEPKIPAEVKRKVPVSKMTVAAVEQMFKDGYTVADVAEHYGYKTTQTVYNFINKNGIKVKVLTAGNDTAKELTEANIPEIRALYTDGPMNLADTAWELGTTKKKLHDFCMKHHLMKVKKDW